MDINCFAIKIRYLAYCNYMFGRFWVRLGIRELILTCLYQAEPKKFDSNRGPITSDYCKYWSLVKKAVLHSPSGYCDYTIVLSKILAALLIMAHLNLPLFYFSIYQWFVRLARRSPVCDEFGCGGLPRTRGGPPTLSNSRHGGAQSVLLVCDGAQVSS